MSRVDTSIPLAEPLVKAPIRVLLTRPVASSAGDYPNLFDQLLDATVSTVASDGVTVRLERENADGSVVVHIDR